MSAMKKQLTWKFGFQKKLRLNYEKSEGDESNASAKFSQPQDLYCNLVDISKQPIYENHSAESDHVYENTCLGEPIYEPVNVFLGLVRREETISPDPNIYEVPPGAIKTCADIEEPDAESLLPPPGFLDYENVYVMMADDDAIKHNKVLITVGDVNEGEVTITHSNSVGLEEVTTASDYAEENKIIGNTAIEQEKNVIIQDDITLQETIMTTRDDIAEQQELIKTRIDTREQEKVLISVDDASKHKTIVITENETEEDKLIKTMDNPAEKEKLMVTIDDAAGHVEVAITTNYAIDHEEIMITRNNAVEEENVMISKVDAVDETVINTSNETAEHEEVTITRDDTAEIETFVCRIDDVTEQKNVMFPKEDPVKQKEIAIKRDSAVEQENIVITRKDAVKQEEKNTGDVSSEQEDVLFTKEGAIKQEKIANRRDCTVEQEKVMITKQHDGEQEKFTAKEDEEQEKNMYIRCDSDTIKHEITPDDAEKVMSTWDNTVGCDKFIIKSDDEEQEEVTVAGEGIKQDKITVREVAEDKVMIEGDDRVDFEMVMTSRVDTAKQDTTMNRSDDVELLNVMAMRDDGTKQDKMIFALDDIAEQDTFVINQDDLLLQEKVMTAQYDTGEQDQVVIIRDDEGEESVVAQDGTLISSEDDRNATSFIEISEDGTWETKNVTKERRQVMEKQAVRAKRINSWIVQETGGEVVRDSIIENKQKTKSYWEQLMMAAELPRALSLGSDGEDASEQEYFDARSQISAHSPAEPVEGMDQAYGPKIVETVAKKLMEVETTKPARNTGEESVIERDIRLQREREEAVAREREEALVRAAARLSKDEPDDGFNSIPNTDSEYGSEEKDSRIMSPEGFLHQRTQSLDSMSSGHSSGSGSGDTGGGRRRVTVKPLDEPEEDQVLPYMRNQKETPIEREIRLAREREEELRREKGLPPLNSQISVPGKQEVRKFNSRSSLLANDPRSMQHRLATSRIQQEINEATEREKELREAGMIHTTSEETVDSKVTRFTDLAEFSIEEQDRKLHKSVSTSHIPQSINDDIQLSSTNNSAPKVENSRHAMLGRSLSQNPAISGFGVRKFPTNLGQKGLMQRFLAARGKMGTLSSGFLTSPGPQHKPVEVTEERPLTRRHSLVQDTASLQDFEGKENGEPQKSPTRPGYISAEEKIQVELEEMQKREEELRLQRARMFAQSQPNLLRIGVDEKEEQEAGEREDILLRSALSNPNLLNSESNHNGEEDSSLDKPSFKSIKKHSALIAQWEDMIQKNIDH